ncbi:annexin D3 [Cornus florida]|uniref:annexin D3 n=1 Tax=Cornus florida TaxID=4283 RepID=UPI00289E98E8|nr:annexin D3 [Cornus florida]XP_059649219.1 annexin D3 [Cornus florida]
MTEEGKSQETENGNQNRNSSQTNKQLSYFLNQIFCFCVCLDCLDLVGRKKEMGTIRVPQTVPSPEDDCDRLKKAFQARLADEKGIIWVLGRRNAEQRRKIRDTYQQLYNESLIQSLQTKVYGDFMKALVLWAYDPPERDARLANEALKSKKKDIKQLQVIVEIACASSPQHLMLMRQAYCSLFDCSIEEDIIANVSPPLRKALLCLVSSYRYDGEVVDSNVASLEAATLHEAIEKKQLDNDDVVWILATRNIFQLKATFAFYRGNYGKPIDEDIKGNGLLESIFRMVIWCLESPEKHFAEVVRASIIGIGTDENALSRAIVTRAEIDMAKIKEEYYNVNKETLANAVTGDTSGSYKDFLLTLVGEQL